MSAQRERFEAVVIIVVIAACLYRIFLMLPMPR